MAIELFRAVGPEEASDLRTTNTFRNPEGIETKYFSISLTDARKYAAMAESSFNDPPYIFVSTNIEESFITSEMRVTVDRGIEAIVIPTTDLPH